MAALAPEEVRQGLCGLWQPLLTEAVADDNTLVLRDYHSPNLMWLPERAGLQEVGILDFQDALLGPAAYDLVSLFQDARLDVPEALEARAVRSLLCGPKRERSSNFRAISSVVALRNARRPTQLEDSRHICAVGET